MPAKMLFVRCGSRSESQSRPHSRNLVCRWMLFERHRRLVEINAAERPSIPSGVVTPETETHRLTRDLHWASVDQAAFATGWTIGTASPVQIISQTSPWATD